MLDALGKRISNLRTMISLKELEKWFVLENFNLIKVVIAFNSERRVQVLVPLVRRE